MEAMGPSETLDHQSKVIGTLSALFNNEYLSDIQLMVNETPTLKAHSFILAAHSDVFKALLDTERWPDAKDRVIHLTEAEDSLPYLEDFLRYLYSGSVTLSTTSVLPLHVLSEKYNVQELRQSCQRLMLANVGAPGSSNRAITWQRYARLMGLGQLEEECLRFIAWNIGTVIQSPDWTPMEAHQLSALLQRSDVVVDDEAVLLRALLAWLSRRPDRAGGRCWPTSATL
ncbi:BTB/POZ domain-containing protein 17-like [Heptranchias perlo]|uniref:BTB/POZ domain-containing protein 17-like n=1 Tax=Heptranchias perlo TaxID=212740 RepID=UPI00355A64A8